MQLFRQDVDIESSQTSRTLFDASFQDEQRLLHVVKQIIFEQYWDIFRFLHAGLVNSGQNLFRA